MIVTVFLLELSDVSQTGIGAQFSSTWPSKSLSIPSPHSSEFGVGDGGIGGIGGGLGLEAHSAFQVLEP